MMNFRTITQALIDVLGMYADDAFRVVGYPGQSKAASEVKGSNRSVQVFFTDGEFPQSKGRWTGPVRFEPTWQIELTASSAASLDLSVMSSDSATATERAAALAALQEASYEADQSFDELVELAYQILMDGTNIDLKLGKGVLSSRWVSRVSKNEPQERGSLVVLTGLIEYRCVTSEDLTGATPVAVNTDDDGTGFIDITVDIDGDDVEKTGVIVSQTE